MTDDYAQAKLETVSLLTTKKESRRPGYPAGIIEAQDAAGQPLFFDAGHRRLIRCFGSYRLSAAEMRSLRLEATEMIFSGGYFLRKRNDSQ